MLDDVLDDETLATTARLHGLRWVVRIPKTQFNRVEDLLWASRLMSLMPGRLAQLEDRENRYLGGSEHTPAKTLALAIADGTLRQLRLTDGPELEQRYRYFDQGAHGGN